MSHSPSIQPEREQADLCCHTDPELPSPVRVRLAVAAGGAVGTGLRAAMAFAIPESLWPWATFIENVSGAFLLGLLLTRLSMAYGKTSVAIPFFCAGLLGSYTTFSTFVVEILRLGDTHPGMAVVYAITSVVLGLLAAHTGRFLAERKR